MWRTLCICLTFAALGAAQTKIDIVNQTSGNLPGGRVTGAVASATTATTATSATSATTATTATALASDPAACSAGQYVSDIAANGTLTCGTPSGGGGSSITRTAVTHSATPTYTRSSAIQQWTQTLTSNVTSSTLSGASAGDLLSFELTQDGTGSRTWAGPTGFPALTLCATANSRTTVQYFWTGSAAILRSYATAGCGAPAIVTDAGNVVNVPDANGTLVTLDATQTLTNKSISASQINSGTMATARLGSGTADNTTFLRGDNTWATPSGGGGSLTLSHCFVTANCAIVGAPGRSAVTAINTTYMMRITVPGSLTLAKLITYFSSGGAGNSTVVAFFADSAGAPGTMLTDAQFRFNNLAAAAVRQVSPISGTPSIPSAGTYWVGWASEDSAALMWTLNAAFTGPGSFLGAMSAKPGIVSCSNGPTGSGVTYALQPTCGVATALTSDVIVPLILASAY